MAVEEHPKWPEWSAALDALQVAKAAVEAHQDLAADNPDRLACAVTFSIALSNYNRISDEIDMDEAGQ